MPFKEYSSTQEHDVNTIKRIHEADMCKAALPTPLAGVLYASYEAPHSPLLTNLWIGTTTIDGEQDNFPFVSFWNESGIHAI